MVLALLLSMWHYVNEVWDGWWFSAKKERKYTQELIMLATWQGTLPYIAPLQGLALQRWALPYSKEPCPTARSLAPLQEALTHCKEPCPTPRFATQQGGLPHSKEACLMVNRLVSWQGVSSEQEDKSSMTFRALKWFCTKFTTTDIPIFTNPDLGCTNLQLRA